MANIVDVRDTDTLVRFHFGQSPNDSYLVRLLPKPGTDEFELRVVLEDFNQLSIVPGSGNVITLRPDRRDRKRA